MSLSSTNYYNVFIEVAEDTKVNAGIEPPLRGSTKSIANYEFELIHQNPYVYSSDDVFFKVHVLRNNLQSSDLTKERELFFSKGRPCFRASPLTKNYGWGVHSNDQGKIAIYGMETEEYARLVKDKNIIKKKAMRSSKK